MAISKKLLGYSLAWFCISVMNISLVYSAEYGPRDFANKRNWTAIVTAFAPEIKAIEKAIKDAPNASINEEVIIKGVRYQIGQFNDEPIIIFTTGISVSNAAMTMQMAIDYFPIKRVLMMGIAGAVKPYFSPGDLSIPERWYFHDESIYANPVEHENSNEAEVRNEAYVLKNIQPKLSERDQYILPEFHEHAISTFKEREKNSPNVPKYINFGFMFPREVSVIKTGWEKPRSMPYFTVSSTLLEHARNAVKNNKPILMPSGTPIKIRVGGNGVTGSVFADNAQYRLWLERVYSAEVTEMESAAVGQVCFINDIDWLVVRSVSDLAGGQKGQNQESVFDGIASGTGAQFVVNFLNHLTKVKD